jgi:hypothetical protein
MKWVTRSHVHVDRVACPWLISRFIDSEAEFLFVPVSQIERNAATALADETRPTQRHLTPPRQEAARPTPVATEALALQGPALRASPRLLEAVGHLPPAHVGRSTQDMCRGTTQPHAVLLANLGNQAAMGVLDGAFDENTTVDMTSFG